MPAFECYPFVVAMRGGSGRFPSGASRRLSSSDYFNLQEHSIFVKEFQEKLPGLESRPVRMGSSEVCHSRHKQRTELVSRHGAEDGTGRRQNARRSSARQKPAGE
jgi:hypothetical protein